LKLGLRAQVSCVSSGDHDDDDDDDCMKAFAWAQFLQAEFYNDVLEREHAALNLYRMAADTNGFAPAAQFAIGWMYQYSFRDGGDPSIAMEYYRKAAEQGCAPAQYTLGRMYENGWGLTYDDGVGVPRDAGRALEYYESAARQGHEDASRSLLVLHGSRRRARS